MSGDQRSTLLPGEPPLILNVDDVPSVRAMRTRILSDAGYAVVEASTGGQALELVASRRPRLILLDVNLPGGLDGITVCDRLKSGPLGRDVAVILVSAAFTSDQSIVAGLSAGADTYLTEPVAPDVLVGVVGAVLRRTVLERDARLALEYSEARYRSLVDHAVFPMYEATLDGTILMANAAFARMVGLSSPAEALGINVTTFYVDPSTRARIVEQFVRESFVGVERDWRRRDGHPLRVRVSGRRLDRADAPVYQVIAEDVSAYHRLESELRQAQKMEAIGRLAGGIAHDFNNMLTAIHGYTDLLLEQLSMSPIAGDLRQIKTAAERATALTRRLLAFSRKQMLQLEPISVDDVVRSVDDAYRRLIGEQIQILVQTASEGRRIMADRSQLEQVLVNLVLNGRDAMPSGGILTITTTVQDVDTSFADCHPPMMAGTYIRLVVSDSGIGMSAETQQHVFEPFFTTKPEGKGTGLGLATVYGIVKQMRGFIWVDSAEGHGTSFALYFPVTDQPSVPHVEGTPRQSAIGKGTILLVEDEDVVRVFLATSLRRHGFTVVDRPNATEALAAVREVGPSLRLVITDVVMPGMTGPALAQRVRAVHPDVPVLLMSGYSAEIADDGHAFGFPWLAKPFSNRTLLAKISELLER